MRRLSAALALALAVALPLTAAAQVSGYTEILNDSTALTKRYRLNCLPPLTCADQGSRNSTTITLDGGALTLTADWTWTGGGGEQVIFNKSVTDATADEGFQLNYTASDTTSGTTGQYVLRIDNLASTEGADALLYLDNSDADDAVVSGILFNNAGGGFTNSITLENGEVISGATANTITFGRNDAGTLTLTAKDDDATAALTILPGGAAAMVLGGASMTTLTVTTSGSGNTVVVLPNESISGAEIENNTGRVNLGLGSWVNCTDQLPLDASGVDAEPDFVAVNTAVVIAYDATGGSVDTQEICTSFVVPADWVSGGTISARVTQGAATVTNIEDFTCRWSIDGAAIGATNSAALANQTAVQTVTVTPAGTLAAGASVGVECEQSDGSADDTVNFHALWFDYTKSQ